MAAVGSPGGRDLPRRVGVGVRRGILKGKTVTCFSAIKDDVVNAGARWVDQDVVVDMPLITARKPDDLPAFTAALIERLKKSCAMKKLLTIAHSPDPDDAFMFYGFLKGRRFAGRGGGCGTF
jgi:hypothetical protein